MPYKFDLESDAEQVYESLVGLPRAGAAELADQLGWQEHRVAAAIDQLKKLSLVRPSVEAVGMVSMVDPESSLAELLVQESELIARQQAINAGKLAIARIIATHTTDKSKLEGEIRELEGRDEIRSEIEYQAHACSVEVAVLAPDGPQIAHTMEASRPLDESVLSRGVRVRYICLDSSIRRDRATMDYAEWLRELGSIVRTATHLPPRMLIYDRRTVIVPVDPQRTTDEALVIQSPGAVVALCNLFDHEWRQATPLSEFGHRDENGITRQARAVLDLLLDGHTDASVARKLGVSVRSIRRVTSDLMHELEAKSRFQAGALAVARGWINP